MKATTTPTVDECGCDWCNMTDTPCWRARRAAAEAELLEDHGKR